MLDQGFEYEIRKTLVDIRLIDAHKAGVDIYGGYPLSRLKERMSLMLSVGIFSTGYTYFGLG